MESFGRKIAEMNMRDGIAIKGDQKTMDVLSRPEIRRSDAALNSA
jgi:hypothetical protein